MDADKDYKVEDDRAPEVAGFTLAELRLTQGATLSVWGVEPNYRY